MKLILQVFLGCFLLNEYQSKTYIIHLYDVSEFILFQPKFKYLTFQEFNY
jgi:hypothetical protein